MKILITLLFINIISSYGFIVNKINLNKLNYAKIKNKDFEEYLDDYDYEDIKEIKYIKKTLYKPRTPNQVKYFNDINNDTLQLLITSGPAGSGKTLFPTQYAAKLLLETDRKVILTRPLISVDEELGYLPGGINEKMHPWVIPIFDILYEFISPQKLEKLIHDKRIEIVPLAFMRGRTFKNCFIIGDELQNASISQMLMLLTRLGNDSKLVITGDISQCDNKENGLLDLQNRMKSFYNKNQYKNFEEMLRNDKISLVNMEPEDVQRSELISVILNIYNS